MYIRRKVSKYACDVNRCRWACCHVCQHVPAPTRRVVKHSSIWSRTRLCARAAKSNWIGLTCSTTGCRSTSRCAPCTTQSMCRLLTPVHAVCSANCCTAPSNWRLTVPSLRRTHHTCWCSRAVVAQPTLQRHPLAPTSNTLSFRDQPTTMLPPPPLLQLQILLLLLQQQPPPLLSTTKVIRSNRHRQTRLTTLLI